MPQSQRFSLKMISYFFSKEKLLIYFRKCNFLIFSQKKIFSDILGNETIFPKKVFPIFREMELFIHSLKFFPELKFIIFFPTKTALKKFLIFSQKKFSLYFGKWNFLALSLKEFLYSMRELSEHQI